MLYNFLYFLHQWVPPLRVFRYVTFRTAAAGITALLICLLLGPWQIQLVNLSGELGIASVAGSPYDLIRRLFTIAAFLQVYLLITMIGVATAIVEAMTRGGFARRSLASMCMRGKPTVRRRPAIPRTSEPGDRTHLGCRARRFLWINGRG